MKILSFFILLSISLISCECNDDERVQFKLNEFEEKLIPFNTDYTVQFVNSTSDTILGLVEAKSVEEFNLNYSDDESCAATIVDIHKTKLLLIDSQDEVELFVEKSYENISRFSIIAQQYGFSPTNIPVETEMIQPSTTSFSSDGFVYENVYIFEQHLEATAIQSIIYSHQKGFVFIKYRNGEYLRLVD